MSACRSTGGAGPHTPSRAANQCHSENRVKTEVVDEENEDIRETSDRTCCGGGTAVVPPRCSRGPMFAFLGALIVTREKQIGLCSS
jgi:hypothetical protein